LGAGTFLPRNPENPADRPDVAREMPGSTVPGTPQETMQATLDSIAESSEQWALHLDVQEPPSKTPRDWIHALGLENSSDTVLKLGSDHKAVAQVLIDKMQGKYPQLKGQVGKSEADAAFDVSLAAYANTGEGKLMRRLGDTIRVVKGEDGKPRNLTEAQQFVVGALCKGDIDRLCDLDRVTCELGRLTDYGNRQVPETDRTAACYLAALTGAEVNAIVAKVKLVAKCVASGPEAFSKVFADAGSDAKVLGGIQLPQDKKVLEGALSIADSYLNKPDEYLKPDNPIIDSVLVNGHLNTVTTASRRAAMMARPFDIHISPGFEYRRRPARGASTPP